MIPVSGAEVAYAYEVFGVEACFATGWLLALVYMATTAFEAISAAWLLAALVPGTEGPVLYQSLGSPVRLSTVVIGVGGTIYLAYLNYRGVRAAARFQDFFTWGLVILSALFMSVGVFFGHTSNLVPLFREGGFGSAVAGFTAVFVTSPFWLAGFNLVPQAMEEAAPGTSVRKVGQVMLLSIAAAVAFYCLVILASAMTQPWKDLLTLELPAAGAFEKAFSSPLLAKIILLAGLFGIVTTWNPLILSASRVLFALGRARIIEPRFGAIHPTHGTPSTAVTFTAVVACAAVCLGRKAIVPIANVGATAFALAFLVTSLGVVKLRRTQPERSRPYRMPGGVPIALAGALGSVCMFVLSIYQPFLDANRTFPLEWGVLIGWAALGALFWAFARRIRAGVSERERRALIVGLEGQGAGAA